jgi:hypothetical protein
LNFGLFRIVIICNSAFEYINIQNIADGNLKYFHQINRPGSDAALPNLKKSRRVSIAGGDRKKGGF